MTGGIALGIDATRWTYWWEYNRTEFLQRDLQLRNGATSARDEFYLGGGRKRDRAIAHGARTEDLDRVVLPALHDVLAATRDRDLTTAVLLALAKVGRDHHGVAFHDVATPHLRRGDQEVRETVALAFGVAARGDERTLRLLLGLARDDAHGRAACDRRRVDARTRAFATFGLGWFVRRVLATGESGRESGAAVRMAHRFRATRTLTALVNAADVPRDVATAAALALGLVPFDAKRAGDRALRELAVAALRQCIAKHRGAAREVVRAHAMTALVRLVRGSSGAGGDDRNRSAVREQLIAGLWARGRSGVRGHDVARSAALALGRLDVDVPVGNVGRAATVAALRRAYSAHRDQQTRWFAALALARLGGPDNRKFLLRAFERGTKVIEQPWAALGLGMLEHRRRARASGPRPAVDAQVAEALQRAFGKSRNAEARAALAIALGLAGCEDAAPAMRESLADASLDRFDVGYLCVALALLRDPAALPQIRGILVRAERRPELMRRAALALAHLGDRQAARLLHEQLTDTRHGVAQLAAFAGALGHLGDRRAIDPLVTTLSNPDRPDLTRAFAAAALGAIAAPTARPWNAPLAEGLNYRAVVPALLGGGTGVLDIL